MSHYIIMKREISTRNSVMRFMSRCWQPSFAMCEWWLRQRAQLTMSRWVVTKTDGLSMLRVQKGQRRKRTVTVTHIWHNNQPQKAWRAFIIWKQLYIVIVFLVIVIWQNTDCLLQYDAGMSQPSRTLVFSLWYLFVCGITVSYLSPSWYLYLYWWSVWYFRQCTRMCYWSCFLPLLGG